MFEIPRLVLIGYGKEDITHGVVWSLSTVFGFHVWSSIHESTWSFSLTALPFLVWLVFLQRSTGHGSLLCGFIIQLRKNVPQELSSSTGL